MVSFFVRWLMNILCVCLFLFFCVQILSFVTEPDNDVVFTNQSVSINGADKILINDNGCLYIGDSTKNVIQIFDLEGNFIYGISLQTGGGDFWMGLSKEELHVYVVRRDVEYTIKNQSVISRRSTVRYDSPDEFYKQFSYNPNVKVRLTLSGNMVYQNIAQGTEQIISLETPLFPLSIGFCFVGILISMIGIFAVNGLFEKLYIQEHTDRNEVIRFFRDRGNKLK